MCASISRPPTSIPFSRHGVLNRAATVAKVDNESLSRDASRPIRNPVAIRYTAAGNRPSDPEIGRRPHPTTIFMSSNERGAVVLNVKLQEYALLAEIIGGLAIIVSLAFVGLQIRQSNSLAATEALKDGTQIWTAAYANAYGTEESTAFFRKAVNHCDQLSNDERGRFFAIMLRFVSAYDNIFNQYKSGRLRDEVFVSIASGYYAITRTPCGKKVLLQDLSLLPDYLVSPSGIAEMSGHETDIKLPSFLVE